MLTARPAENHYPIDQLNVLRTKGGIPVFDSLEHPVYLSIYGFNSHVVVRVEGLV